VAFGAGADRANSLGARPCYKMATKRSATKWEAQAVPFLCDANFSAHASEGRGERGWLARVGAALAAHSTDVAYHFILQATQVQAP
jgi:hypothetical protein